MRKDLALFVVLLLLVSACNRGGEDDTTTTAAMAVTTTSVSGATGSTEPAEDADNGDEDTTSTTEPMAAVPEYEIAHRSPGDNGDTLVIVLSDGEGITDRDLEQLIFDVVDTYSPVAVAYVVDDASAVEPALADPETLTDEEKAILETHLLLKLTDGTSVSFEGPLEDTPGFEIGS